MKLFGFEINKINKNINHYRIPATRKELKVLEFLKLYKKTNGYFPTRKETAVFFNITPAGVQKFIQNLEKKGHIKKSIKSRDIKII